MYGIKLKTKSKTPHSKAKSMPAATRKIVAGIAIKAFTLVRMTRKLHRSCLTASNGANRGLESTWSASSVERNLGKANVALDWKTAVE
jgi:hypothetical protein